MKRKLIMLFLLLIPVYLFSAGSYQQLYNHYFALSNALAQDSVPEAKKSASDFGSTISALLEGQSKNEPVQAQDLPREEKETIRRSLATLANLSKTIANVDKLDQMRKPFEEMTSIMGRLQGLTKIQADEYYCPMVKKTWLQPKDSKEVRNPYAGKSMRSCGEKKKS
jgi:hypothetical protein